MSNCTNCSRPAATGKVVCGECWEDRRWISVKDRLPKAEERVLVCAEMRGGGKALKRIVAAMYEDGTVWRDDSSWNFEDIGYAGEYDEERDDWKIKRGWWEYTLYNDECGCYPIDDFVTHWMPLPEPPKEDGA